MNKIAICSDHAGFLYKEKLIKHLKTHDFNIKDFGCHSIKSVDYTDYVHPLAKAISSGEFSRAIALCGSGNGAVMVANKYPKVRAALCWNFEITKLARTHNDANILCLPARFITYEQAEGFVDIFLKTNFEGGRHVIRVKKIDIKI